MEAQRGAFSLVVGHSDTALHAVHYHAPAFLATFLPYPIALEEPSAQLRAHIAINCECRVRRKFFGCHARPHAKHVLVDKYGHKSYNQCQQRRDKPSLGNESPYNGLVGALIL